MVTIFQILDNFGDVFFCFFYIYLFIKIRNSKYDKTISGNLTTTQINYLSIYILFNGINQILWTIPYINDYFFPYISDSSMAFIVYFATIMDVIALIFISIYLIDTLQIKNKLIKSIFYLISIIYLIISTISFPQRVGENWILIQDTAIIGLNISSIFLVILLIYVLNEILLGNIISEKLILVSAFSFIFGEMVLNATYYTGALQGYIVEILISFPIFFRFCTKRKDKIKIEEKL